MATTTEDESPGRWFGGLPQGEGRHHTPVCLPSIRPSLPTLYQSSGWSASRKLPLLQRDRETLEYFDKIFQLGAQLGAQLAAAANNFGVLRVLLASTLKHTPPKSVSD